MLALADDAAAAKVRARARAVKRLWFVIALAVPTAAAGGLVWLVRQVPPDTRPAETSLTRTIAATTSASGEIPVETNPPVEQRPRPLPARRAPPPATLHPYSRYWYGVVYSLEDLAPVAEATLEFRSAGELIATAVTDAQGRYLAECGGGNAEAGISVQMAQLPAGFRPGLYDDPDPALMSRTAKERAEALEQISDDEVGAVLLKSAPIGIAVEQNLVLLPPRKADEK